MAQGRIRRLVMRLLRCVWVPVVSFVLVVAVAMACAVWSHSTHSIREFDVDENGAWHLSYALPEYETNGDEPIVLRGTGISEYIVPMHGRPWKPEKQDPNFYAITICRSGFPFRSMRSTVDESFDGHTASIWVRGIKIDRKHTVRLIVEHIPLVPEPVGMVLNVLIYSAAIVLGRLAWRRAVVYRRRRKSLCITCAYPLGDFAVCPECGNPTGREA